jgi:hypothetical protein
LVKLIAPIGWMGHMEMKCIFDIGKNLSILAKVTQVSDVAHGARYNFFLEKNYNCQQVLGMYVTSSFFAIPFKQKGMGF